MEIVEVRPDLGDLQTKVIETCKRYQQALREACPPFRASNRGDIVISCCEDRIRAIRDFLSRIQTLEEKDTWEKTNIELELANEKAAEVFKEAEGKGALVDFAKVSVSPEEVEARITEEKDNGDDGTTFRDSAI